MLKREAILKILNHARHIDPNYEIFGASEHQYKLNPPIRKSFVREVEKRYGFQLPEDYFKFITEIGDGGAGPDYGIRPFTSFLIRGGSPTVEKFNEAYRYSLANLFVPLQMQAYEVEHYAITTKEAYERNPERYFIYENDDDWCDTDGFFVLGTHGCQWDFGIITAGEMYGQIFDTDNEYAYAFVSHSFDEFYQDFLDWISDDKKIQKELERWRNRHKNICKIK